MTVNYNRSSSLRQWPMGNFPAVERLGQRAPRSRYHHQSVEAPPFKKALALNLF
jgi:hypothetical protein